MFVNDLLQEVIAEAKSINIPISDNISSQVRINSRIVRRLGRCKKINDKFEIEVAKILLQAKTCHIKRTLAHEILHTCPDCMNHGEVWQNYAEKMNDTYGYGITRLADYADMGIKLPYKYIIKCEKCGQEFGRTRMSKLVKYPNIYRCKCGGTLKRVGGTI